MRTGALRRLPDDTTPAEAVARHATTVLLGLGNTILSDDGVGIKVVRHIAEHGAPPYCDIKEAEVAGFALLDLLEGYDRAVIVDAARLHDARPGDVTVFDLESLEPSLHLVAGHQIDLPSALELGRRLERPVPRTVHVVGVQICDDTTFSEECTPAIRAAIPVAADIAMRLVARGR